MSSLNISQQVDEYIQNANNDEMFYKKNENSEDFYVIPLSLAKTPEINVKDFSCLFCQNISMNPFKCEDCWLIGCSKCVKNSINKSNYTCSKSINNSHNFKTLEEELKKNFDNLLIACPSREANCKETILYKNLKEHLEKCRFWKGTYSCLGCGKHDILSEMECHVLVCEEITWNCDYCNLPFKRMELGMHMEICDSKPKQCVKCNQMVQSSVMDKHISKDECMYQMMMEMKSSFDEKFRQYDCKLEKKDNTIEDLTTRIKNLEDKLNLSSQLHENHIENHKNHEEKIQQIYNLLFEAIENRYKELNEKLNGILKKITELKFFSNNSILEDPEFLKTNQEKPATKKLTKIKNLICTKTLAGHQGPICCIIQMRWDKDLSTFVSGSSDKSIKVWNAEEGVCVKTLLGHTHWVYYLCQLHWKKDQSTLISGSRDMTLKVWNIEQGVCLKSVNAHNNLISGLVQVKNYMQAEATAEKSKDSDSLIFGADGALNSAVIATCSWDRTIKLWNIEDLSAGAIKTLKGHRDSVRCVTQMKWSKDASTLLSGASDKTIKVWDILKAECKMTLTGHSDSVYHLEFIKWAKDEVTVASASYDKTLKLWDIEKGVCLKTLMGHTHYVNNITQLRWDGDETVLVSCSFDKSIRLWNIESGKVMKSLKGHSEYVMGMCQLITNKDYITLVSGSGDNSIKIWE